jgi:hypothetical protein
MREAKFDEIGPVWVERVPTVMEVGVTPGAALVAAPAALPTVNTPALSAAPATASLAKNAARMLIRLFLDRTAFSRPCPWSIPPGCRSL